MKPSARQDFRQLETLLSEQIPFQFIRFSDGEMEIIRNERLEIVEGRVTWSKGVVEHSYPAFDFKSFDPALHQKFREDLLASARGRSERYFKGVPARHNRALSDRDLMIALNGGSLEGLTFADLFLNGNYVRFRRRIVPLIQQFDNVLVVGNYRMQPTIMNRNWRLVPIGDNFFSSYEATMQATLQQVLQAPAGTLVLASASSLTNVLGHWVSRERRDMTLLDVGTTLHDQMGMESGIREYHVVAQSWSRATARRKLRYRLSAGYRLKW